MYLCICKGVTERAVQTAVNDGVRSMRGLRNQLGVTSCCGKCAVPVKACLKQTLAAQHPQQANPITTGLRSALYANLYTPPQPA